MYNFIKGIKVKARNILSIILLMKWMNKNTIYITLKRYERRRTIKRKVGSRKKTIIMTKGRKTALKKRINNKDDVSQYNEAKKYNCTQQCIWRCLKSLKVKRYKKKIAQTLSVYLIDTFVGHRNVIWALNTIFITFLLIMLISDTFSINYKKAHSDFSNSMKSCDQIYG